MTTAAPDPAPALDLDEPAVPASLLVEAPRDADDLTVIKGIGPGLARQLNGLGVYKLAQLAEFSEEDLTWIDANLSSFKGRCFRDDWIGQAKALLG
jgi:NADH-quinone oxidoreductase subunit E